MTWVGQGGSYITEVTYRYVGGGVGEFGLRPAMTVPSRVPIFIGIGTIGVLAILAVVLVATGPATTTQLAKLQPPSTGAPSDCFLWGDPHIETFDHSFPNFYKEGEFWLVKSAKIGIQVRYLNTPFTNHTAATNQVALGGASMEGHVFSVGPMNNGQITCDGKEILASFPDEDTCGPLTLKYNGEGKLVDDAQRTLTKHILHIDHPWHLHLQVMRWANHLNVRITMNPSVEPVDGHCGNFNGEAGDDITDAINAREAGRRIPEGELFFRHGAIVDGTLAAHTIADCPESKREHATKLCQASQPSVGGMLLDSCVFDVCFGGDQYAAEDGLAESQATS